MRSIKRAFDIVGSLLGLLAAAPFLAAAVLALRCTRKGPAIFRQLRAGFGGEPFTLYKLRTMTDERDAAGKLLPDEQRMTAVGRLLRGASLDELPQLVNVLKGEMSLVGPRPLYIQYLERYNEFQRRRLEARPGITGWAQIHGRNAISWERRFELDVWYVDHRSFWLDLRILAATFGKVIRREGISRQNHATMPEFLGTREPSSR